MPISSPYAKDKALLAFGAAVRAARKDRGVSQEELALRSEIDRSYLGAIERGEQNTGLLHMVRIAHALNITIVELMSRAHL